MKIRRAKVVLVGFVLFLIGLVVLSDSGQGGRLLQLAEVIPLGDKVGHLGLFGALSFLVNWLQCGAELHVFGWRMLKGSTLILPVVTLEECSQIFFRSRTFDLGDLAADVLGIWLCGKLAVVCLNRRRMKVRALAMADR